jgi:hypothetical protein
MTVAGTVRWLAERKAHSATQAASGDQGIFHDQYSGICRVPVARSQKKPVICVAFAKRLKGLEPSTFCMASRRSSQLSYSRAGA